MEIKSKTKYPTANVFCDDCNGRDYTEFYHCSQCKDDYCKKCMNKRNDYLQGQLSILYGSLENNVAMVKYGGSGLPNMSEDVFEVLRQHKYKGSRYFEKRF